MSEPGGATGGRRDGPRSIALVFNPAAGGGVGGAAARMAARILRSRGFRVEESPVPGPGQGAEAAAGVAPFVDMVTAVGGDGTVNEVVNGLPEGLGPALGVIPAGTVNVFALEMGIPFSVEEACAVLAEGHLRQIDWGVAREQEGAQSTRRFVLMVGAGIDAGTIRNLDPGFKKRWKRTAFVVTGVKAFLRSEPPVLEVDVDGRIHSATFTVVGNCRYYGGRFGVTTGAVPDDGLLDVVSLSARGFVRNALFWLGLPWGAHLRHPGVAYVRGRVVRVAPSEGSPTVWFHVDGELAGTLPATFEVEEGAVRVAVPRWGR